MGALGFYLRVGDPTACGGKILTGDETLSGYGVAGFPFYNAQTFKQC